MKKPRAIRVVPASGTRYELIDPASIRSGDEIFVCGYWCTVLSTKFQPRGVIALYEIVIRTSFLHGIQIQMDEVSIVVPTGWRVPRKVQPDV